MKLATTIFFLAGLAHARTRVSDKGRKAQIEQNYFDSLGLVQRERYLASQYDVDFDDMSFNCQLFILKEFSFLEVGTLSYFHSHCFSFHYNEYVS